MCTRQGCFLQRWTTPPKISSADFKCWHLQLQADMDSVPMLQNTLGCISLMKFKKIIKFEVFFAKPKEANTVPFLEPNGSVIHAGDTRREPMINKQTLLHFFCDIQLAISCWFNPTVNDSKHLQTLNCNGTSWCGRLDIAAKISVATCGWSPTSRGCRVLVLGGFPGAPVRAEDDRSTARRRVAPNHGWTVWLAVGSPREVMN